MSELAHAGGTASETREALARSDLALSDTTRWPEPVNGSDAETDDRHADRAADQLVARKRVRRRRFRRGHTRPVSPPSGPPDPDALHERLAPAPRRRWPVLVLLTAAGIIGYIAAGPPKRDAPPTPVVSSGEPTAPVVTPAPAAPSGQRSDDATPDDAKQLIDDPPSSAPTPTRPARSRAGHRAAKSDQSFAQIKQLVHTLEPEYHCFFEDDCPNAKQLEMP